MSQDRLEEFIPESLRPPVRRPLIRKKPPGALATLGDLASAAVFACLLIFTGAAIAFSLGQGTFGFWVGCVIVGAVVGEMKGDIKAGTLWAAFLGPLGLIIVLVMPNQQKLAAAAQQAAQQARLVQLQEAQLKELQELRARLGTEADSGSRPHHG